jgi:hypothetical protein
LTDVFKTIRVFEIFKDVSIPMYLKNKSGIRDFATVVKRPGSEASNLILSSAKI